MSTATTTSTPATPASPVADPAGPVGAPAHEADSSPAGVDLAGVAADLAQTMPEVQEHAVQQARLFAEQAAASPVDKAGAVFEPAIHAVDATGAPVMTAGGAYAKKRGRKSATPGAAQSTMPAAKSPPGTAMPASPGAQTMMAQQQAARIAGIQAAGLVFAVGTIIGGEEWHPRIDPKIGLDEKSMMESAMGDYFVSQGKTDIPPGVALAFVMLAYAAPRFAMPKTQSRVATVKAKVVQWWTNRKLRKMGMTANIEASRVGEKK